MKDESSKAGVIRSESATAVAGLYLVLGVSAIVTVAVAKNLLEAGLGVLGMILFATLGVRAACSSIRFDDSGVTARADRFTRHLGWDEIQRFDFRLRKGLGAYTRDGTWIRLQDYGLAARKDAAVAVKRLEEELGRHRRARGVPSK